MKDNAAVIVNLTEQSWTLHRSYGTFTIPGTPTGGQPGGSYSSTLVTGRTAMMDLGDKRSIEVPITAIEVGQDLCHEINADGGEDSYFGVFVAAGEEPTDQELADNRARLEAFYRRLIVAADREWERSHSYLFINDVERRAAHYLGLEKEWFYRVRETAECPGCGEKIRPHVAVCKTCGAILDRVKAAALGLVAPVTSAGQPTMESAGSLKTTASPVEAGTHAATLAASLPVAGRAGDFRSPEKSDTVKAPSAAARR